MYLHDFDTWMKYNRKLEFYGRYVDDFYVVHRDKEFLVRLTEEVRDYLRREEKLTLHPRKFYLQRVEKGVMYLGIVIKPYYRLPANRTKANFYEAVRRWNRRLCSGGLPGADEFVFRLFGALRYDEFAAECEI